jgi:hypothetical protein
MKIIDIGCHIIFGYVQDSVESYKITTEQAKKLGFQNLAEVTIFGFPGMLPQKLDSVNLNLQEIASHQKDTDLFFYLKSANTSNLNEKGDIEFHPNLYSDSLSYILGKKINPLRIKIIYSTSSDFEQSILYKWTWLKKNEINLINSGRNWYSKSIGPGVTRGHAFPLQTKNDDAWKLIASVMAQSNSSSTITLAMDDQVVFNASLDPIPPTTYGVKGKQVLINESFSPKNRSVGRFKISFDSGDPSAAGYLEYVGLATPYSSHELEVGVYHSTHFNTSLIPATGLSIWNIDDFFNPINYNFIQELTAQGHLYVVFDPAKVNEIVNLQSVNFSIRSSTSWPSLVIISPKAFSFSAEKLRMHKLGMGIFAEVAYIEDIYDVFGYGNKDLNALRNFLAWQFHSGKSLKNVLILGKGTFDYRGILGGRPNVIPIYTSRNSLDPLASFSSDDYLGLLDYGQGEWFENKEGDENIQVGVGRLPVINKKEASMVIDKIIAYESNAAPGQWKRTVTLVADDGDGNLHLRDSELQSEFLTKNHPSYYQRKIYLDRYEQEKPGDRQVSPQTKHALEDILDKGTLVLNYVGHGNETTLTAEAVFTVSDIENWADQDHLALWVTATCEFGRHDSPFIRSAAEELLTAPNKGAIGLLSTGRPVFSSANFSLNEAFIQEVFRLTGGQPQDLGAIFKNTKNKSQKGVLNRNFSLIGDPSMYLTMPEFNVIFTSITDPNTHEKIDTLISLTEIAFEANITNSTSGQLATSFDGLFTLEIMDRSGMDSTLGDESRVIKFVEEKTILFNGSGMVCSGIIKGDFVLPVSPNFENRSVSMRISAVGTENKWDAAGYRSMFTKEIIDNDLIDEEGPKIEADFNGQKSPLVFPTSTINLLATLSDQSGINLSDYDPNKSLSIQVNDNPPIMVNSEFVATNNSYKSGNLLYVLENLKEGDNLVTILAYDNLGNKSILEKKIRVEGSDRLQILCYKTYPNPARTRSNFEVEHNQPGKNLALILIVYQTDGKILFEYSERLVKAESRIKVLTWHFLQSQPKYPAKGTYIYKLTLQAEDTNSIASVSGQIVIQ